MIYSPDQGFLFVHIYKTGGNSIRKVLEPYDERYGLFHRLKARLSPEPVLRSGRFPKHSFVSKAQSELGSKEFNRLFRFAFVRNPWDWQVSLYHYILKHPENPDYESVRGMNSFDDYVSWRVDGRIRLQSDFLNDESGKSIVNFVGRFETLQDDFDQICQEIRIPLIRLPHLNKGTRRNYRTMYTIETQALFAEAYRIDIERFNYEF